LVNGESVLSLGYLLLFQNTTCWGNNPDGFNLAIG